MIEKLFFLNKREKFYPEAEKPQGRGTIWARRILIFVVIAYIAGLILGPIITLVISAFEEGYQAVLVALSQPQVLSSMWMTFWIAIVVIIVHGFFGTVVSWVLVRDRFIGRGFLNGLIDIPFAVSPVVVGYMLLLLFGRNGIFAPVLNSLDIRVAFAVPGMVLATLFVTLPFMVRELVPVLEGLGINQEQAAATLGASGFQTFWRVTLPSLRPGIIYGLTLTFARALGEFGAVLVIGGGIIGRTETLTIFIFRALDDRQYISAYSAGLLLGLFSIVLVLGIDWLRRRAEN
ncbi:MAG: sulfate ABC transporter permease subunit [Anaerolineaceae bacterium]|nr:sulfate ABC transporter permease subunit [Anaerolineaceae bacterium]